MEKNIEVLVSGFGGDGIVTMGKILSIGASRMGYEVIHTKTYGAEQRGSTVFAQISVGKKLFYQENDLDVILMLRDDNRMMEYVSKLSDNSIFIYNSDAIKDVSKYQLKDKVSIHPIPLETIATQGAGSKKSLNAVSIGILSKLIGLDYGTLRSIVQKKMSSSDEESDSYSKNVRAYELGYSYFKDKNQDISPFLKSSEKSSTILLDGNEAIAYGAIKAGCDFFAGYPITPSSTILQILSSKLPQYGGWALQMEDEIASMAAVTGASLAGKKAMTATSGPGMSLKQENLGLALMLEVPVVIASVQRGGPSTGDPTTGAQSDLMQAIYGTHGDSPKIVIAPGKVEQCFFETIRAFNLAEKYQVPVILLTDGFLANRIESIKMPNLEKIVVENRKHPVSPEDFKRYSGLISEMPAFGQEEYMHRVTGLSHDEEGKPTRDTKIISEMMDKRRDKLLNNIDDIASFQYHGEGECDEGIIVWGSSLRPSLRARMLAEKDGKKINVMQVLTMHPLKEEPILKFMQKSKGKIYVPEMNQGQLIKLIDHIAAKAGKDLVGINEYGGNLINSETIYARIKGV